VHDDAPKTRERERHPLCGRVAVVSGVSRRDGIGYATACQLAAYGASLFVQHFQPHDHQQDWGADDLATVLQNLRGCLAVDDARIADIHADFAQPETVQQVIDAAVAEFGHVDILVGNHAASGRSPSAVTANQTTRLA